MADMRRSLLALLLASALAAPVSSAQAAVPAVSGGSPQPVTSGGAEARSGVHAAAASSQYLWATVNRCDTASSPNQMGVRASMPGNGERQRMYMRFRAQYWDGDAWRPVAGVGVSRWVYAGSARYRSRQAGWTFDFDQPDAGSTYTLRGVVEYQWRAQKVKGAGRADRRWHRRARRLHRRAHRRHRAHGWSRRAHRRWHRRIHRLHRRAHRRHARRAVRVWRSVAGRRRATASGIRGVRGGDPVGTSKASCLIW
jgi:hypothetical protein